MKAGDTSPHAHDSSCVDCGESALTLLRFDPHRGPRGTIVCVRHDPNMPRSSPLRTHLAKVALVMLLVLVGCEAPFHHYVGDGVTPGVFIERANPASCASCGLCDDVLMATTCEDGVDAGCRTDIAAFITPAMQQPTIRRPKRTTEIIESALWPEGGTAFMDCFQHGADWFCADENGVRQMVPPAGGGR